MIQKLSENVIKYISAGEVIESPYSVVKELIENSIDANADYISIYLKDAGMKLIKVYDNGDGITEKDLDLVTERYATSKINTTEDLEKTKTLGFRGEALASVSSVAKLSIISCHKNSIDRTAYKADYLDNKLIDKYEYAHNQGTTIIVEDLFYNTPARKKFIKSDKSEIKKIFNLIAKLNIIYPNIRFSLTADEKDLYSTYGSLDNKTLMLSHLRKFNMKDNILDIDVELNGIKIKGFISNHKFTLKRKSEQILSINKRIVENPEIKKSIEQGYRKYIPKNLYPIYFFDITVPPEELDINCHPRKDIVRYTKNDELQNLFFEIISSLYQSSITTPQKQESNIFSDDEKTYTVIGQLKNSYLILEYEDMVYFIDQHALHERMLFETFKKELKEKTEISEILNSTVIITLSNQQMSYYYDKKSILEEYGFEIDLFGENSIIVRQVPYLIKDNNQNEISEIIEDVLESDKSDWLDNLIIDLSCKSAIKSNTELTDEKIREFVDFMIDNKITSCPHGRPLFFTLSFSEMGRKLKRII